MQTLLLYPSERLLTASTTKVLAEVIETFSIS